MLTQTAHLQFQSLIIKFKRKITKLKLNNPNRYIRVANLLDQMSTCKILVKFHKMMLQPIYTLETVRA